ncbi:uncharacterized protein HMPREF1541_10810 [Cyphellophora europaea CBS 101466]|uniref:Uncharacterized protein n=1 Tax=Cyphellophora europaea (strain CBS 101466) TaxID=1220924 RepID=W2S8K0_CYPE1|nr:uncharacterized protein HMPREF1541_10810 [Cyphellophora europaea CBS 101466]ETN44259.1 hypothetical protein HMPREF1541_10810 [Cyphellophora europaea CBS 101466]
MATMSVEQFRQTNRVNLEGTFLTAREWLRGIQSARNPDTLQNMSLVVFGSEAGLMGVKSNADYASSKAALQGLVLSLAPDAASIHPRARVNLIAPGPVDTPQFRKEIAEDPLEGWTEVATVAQGRPTPMSAVAYSCLFLASERYSSSVTGQFHRLDGGKSGKLFHLPARGSIR